MVVRHHLIDSQVLMRCPPLRRVSRVKAAAESSPVMEVNNVPQITVKFFLKANNRTGGKTSYILWYGIEKAYCTPSDPIVGK